MAATNEKKSARSAGRRSSPAPSVALDKAFAFAWLLENAANKLTALQRAVDERRLLQVAVRAAVAFRQRPALEEYARGHGVVVVHIGPLSIDELASRVAEHVARELERAQLERDAFATKLLRCRRSAASFEELFEVPRPMRAERDALLATRNKLLSASVGVVRLFFTKPGVDLGSMIECLCRAREAQHRYAEAQKPGQGRGLRATTWDQELLSIVEDPELRTAGAHSTHRDHRLHRLDPEEYLRCLIRLVPLWPEDRMLELSPLFWERTRARLDPHQLAAELGHVDVPAEPLDTSTAAQQKAAN